MSVLLSSTPNVSNMWASKFWMALKHVHADGSPEPVSVGKSLSSRREFNGQRDFFGQPPSGKQHSFGGMNTFVFLSFFSGLISCSMGIVKVSSKAWNRFLVGAGGRGGGKMGLVAFTGSEREAETGA